MTTNATAGHPPSEERPGRGSQALPEPGLPPGPALPATLQGIALLTRLRPYLRRCQRRYGDLFTVQVRPFGDIVVPSDPALIKRTFTAAPTTLHAGEDSPLGPILGWNSLLVIDEEVHLRQRRLLLPPFHGERIKAYEQLFERVAREEIAQWPEGRDFPVAPSTMRITLRAILSAVFGARGARLERLERLMPPFTTLGSALTPFPFLQRDVGRWSPWGRFRRLRAEIDALCDELIEEARRDPLLDERADVLALLVQARDEQGEPMRDVEIRDQLMTMLAAGHETTAAQLAWTVECLRRHPELLERLVAEADAGGRELRDATIREVQRLRPSIMFTTRLVKQPFELGGYLLPSGTLIALAGALTHYDPRLFPDPFAFAPERFLGRAPETYAWLPFGGGVRRCIGASFAHMEMDVVLREILRTWEIEPTRAAPELTRFRGVAHAPADGGVIRVRRRTGGGAGRGPSARAARAAAPAREAVTA